MTSPLGATGSRPLENRTVLVVDDAAAIRGLLQTALSEAGARALLAEDGVAALSTLETVTPDLILLDLVMPRLDGWALLAQLRRSPRTAAIPVVLQTSAEDYASFDRARRDGVAAFISKPFRLNELIETCRRVFEGARPLQGTAARSTPTRTVAIRTLDGRVATTAELTDLDTQGGHLEMVSPLPVGAAVLLGPLTPAGEALRAEVRWVTCTPERYFVGVLFTPER